MFHVVRSALAGAACLALTVPLLAQPGEGAERPSKHVPVKAPTKKELDRREALHLYGIGLLQERANKLAEAARTLEEARRLDPGSADIVKALVPIYLALDRVTDALAACRRALQLAPDDYETGYLYARQLRSLGRDKDASAALKRALRSGKLADRPDVRAQLWFDLAALSERQSDWAGAERSFRKVADILEKPAPLVAAGAFTAEEVAAQAAETYERLGRACLKAGAPGRAVAAFEQAQKKDPARAGRLSLNLSEVYEGQGKLREALERLDDYLRTQPQGTSGYERKVALQRKLGKGNEVVPGLEAASGRDPNNVALKLLLAREYRAARRPREAAAAYEALLRLSVGPDVYRGLFQLYKDEGPAGGEKALVRLDAAVRAGAGEDEKPRDRGEAAKARAMLTVLREDPGLMKLVLPAAGARLGKGRLAYATRVLLGALAAHTRQLGEAEKLYRSCLDKPGGPGEAEAEVYIGLLRVLGYQHKNAEIIAVCKQGLAKAQATNRALFHQRMALAYLMLGKDKEALASADEAVRIAGGAQRLGMRALRVQVLSTNGEHAKALAECRELLKDYPSGGDLRDARVAYSSALLAAGQPEKSEEQLELVIQADPNDATALNNLGYQLADRNKRLPEAEKLIRQALDLDRQQRSGGASLSATPDQDNAAYVDSLGWVLFRQGKLDEARRELKRASKMLDGEDDPVVWDHLGDVYFRQKEPARAAAAWRKCLALYEAGARRKADPRYREVRAKLKLATP
jgi:tetratricopeptide (TPR) repeat protein